MQKITDHKKFLQLSKYCKNNDRTTNETKVRLFKIRLNSRSIVTQSQLHCFELDDDNLYKFCEKESGNFDVFVL